MKRDSRGQTEHVEFAVDDGLFVDNRREEDVPSLVLYATSMHLNEVLTAAGHRPVLGHLLFHLHRSITRPFYSDSSPPSVAKVRHGKKVNIRY